MSIVHIPASTEYDVEIEPGLLDKLGNRAAKVITGRNALIVTDDTVGALYLRRAALALEEVGFVVSSFVFPHGEASKTGITYLAILDELARNRLTRNDVVVALGGGVVGDLAGFAAATYLRGVACIQIPTTLLAMVDSSVGGKTAIDLPAGKNLAGAFHQPKYVLCDPELLTTLPDETLQDGCAEVIKYAILGSGQLFDRLVGQPLSSQYSSVIETCVAMKRDYVAQDEFDRGLRQYLNLGHTIGHAVEAASNYTLSHGRSVAIGTAMIARAAEKLGFCTTDCCQQIDNILLQYGLPIRTELSDEILLRAATGDKKRLGDRITLVVPKAIGSCVLHNIPLTELALWIGMGR